MCAKKVYISIDTDTDYTLVYVAQLLISYNFQVAFPSSLC